MTHIQRIPKNLDWRIILTIVSFLAVLWLQTPRLGDEFRVDEDFRLFYWMNKFQDGSLFPNYFLGYTMIHLPWADVPVTFNSLGYSLLFYVASFVITPISFSKILSIFLMPLTGWYLFEFGQSVGPRNTGIILALGFLFLNLASSSSISITNGLQRSFATSLIIVLIYYLHRQKYIAAAILLLVSALIYAPVFALGIAIWGLLVLKGNWSLSPKQLPIPEGVGYLFVALCLGALILTPALLSQFADASSEKESVEVERQEQDADAASVSYEYLWDNPTFRTGGAYPLFIIFPFVGRGGLVDLGEDMINLLILLTIGCLIYLVRGGRAFDLPDIIWCMLWATLIMFVVAWLSIWLTNSLLLYWPSRYTRVGLFLFLLMFVFLNGVNFVKEAPTLVQRNPQRLIWLIVGIEILVLGLIVWYPSHWAKISGFNMKWLLAIAGFVFGFLGVAMIRKPPRVTPNLSRLSRSLPGRVSIGVVVVFCLSGWGAYAPLFTEVSYLNPSPTERALFRFLETLPKDVLIAGTPCALDSVPLFAKRSILFSCEHGSRETVVPEALKAYYTDDRQVIIDFCHTHNVDYLVVDLNTYSRPYLDKGQIFFEPYNQELLASITGQDTFVLAEVPDEVKVFQAENLFVVPCDKLEGSN